MFRQVSVQEKTRLWQEGVLSEILCVFTVQVIFIWLWPALTAAGVPRNFGMMMPLPSPAFSPSDTAFLRTIASVNAFFILGPALVLCPLRYWWVSLLGLGLPWGLMATFGLISPSFPGGLAARLLNGSEFLAIGLVEWGACFGILHFLCRRF